MYININIITVIAIIVAVITIVGSISLFIEAILKNRLANPQFIVIIFGIIILCMGALVCNIDYSKGSPAEIYTHEDVTGAYNAGYDDGLYENQVTNSIEAVEQWLNNIETVTIGEDGQTIHIIDSNKEEWILVSSDYQN